MGFLDLFGKKKAELLELQKLVIENSPDRLIMSERKLKELARQAAARDLAIMQDCIRIVEKTTKPDTFFPRLDLLVAKTASLQNYERFIKFGGASPSAAFQQLCSDYQECVHEFLVRYFCDIFDKAEKLKTDKGKFNKYKLFYDSLQPFYKQMNEENIDYVETKYRAYTRGLTK
jgi:hypothetical protein